MGICHATQVMQPAEVHHSEMFQGTEGREEARGFGTICPKVPYIMNVPL